MAKRRRLILVEGDIERLEDLLDAMHKGPRETSAHAVRADRDEHAYSVPRLVDNNRATIAGLSKGAAVAFSPPPHRVAHPEILDPKVGRHRFERSLSSARLRTDLAHCDVLVFVRRPEIPDAPHVTTGRVALASEAVRGLYDRGVDSDRGDARQRYAPSEHTAVFCGVVPLGRSWLRARVAIRDPGIVSVPIEQVRGGEDQTIVCLARLRDQISNEQPERTPPRMAMVVVRSQRVDIDPGAGLDQG